MDLTPGGLILLLAGCTTLQDSPTTSFRDG